MDDRAGLPMGLLTDFSRPASAAQERRGGVVIKEAGVHLEVAGLVHVASGKGCGRRRREAAHRHRPKEGKAIVNTPDKRASAIHRSDTIRHTAVRTGLSYDDAIAAFEREVGHLDPAVKQPLLARKAPWSDVEREIEAAGGVHGLMIIARADQGAITSLSGREKRCRLYLVGNPVIANRIMDIDMRAGFYVPFRVAVYGDENAGEAVISYDRPSSFLAALGRAELAEIGESLDRKIDAVVAAIVAVPEPATAASHP